MPGALRTIKQWVPASIGLAIVVASLIFAVTRQSAVTQDIQQLTQLGENLTQTADIARQGARTPSEARELQSEKDDLQTRLRDATMPGLVQAELMAAARAAQLDVREIQPLTGSTPAGSSTSNAYPGYRVSVRGSYPQIAEYMTACKDLRLPARVRSFRVSPVAAVAPDGQPVVGQKGILTAEITVEAFVPVSESAKGA